MDGILQIINSNAQRTLEVIYSYPLYQSSYVELLTQQSLAEIGTFLTLIIFSMFSVSLCQEFKSSEVSRERHFCSKDQILKVHPSISKSKAFSSPTIPDFSSFSLAGVQETQVLFVAMQLAHGVTFDKPFNLEAIMTHPNHLLNLLWEHLRQYS